MSSRQPIVYRGKGQPAEFDGGSEMYSSREVARQKLVRYVASKLTKVLHPDRGGMAIASRLLESQVAGIINRQVFEECGHYFLDEVARTARRRFDLLDCVHPDYEYAPHAKLNSVFAAIEQELNIEDDIYQYLGTDKLPPIVAAGQIGQIEIKVASPVDIEMYPEAEIYRSKGDNHSFTGDPWCTVPFSETSEEQVVTLDKEVPVDTPTRVWYLLRYRTNKDFQTNILGSATAVSATSRELSERK